MMKRLKIKYLLWSFITITLLLVACNNKVMPFKIAFNTWVGYGPFYIAQEKGFFKDAGLQVELIRMEGTGERRAALIANRIDALGSTIDDFVVGLSQGLNGIMVLAIDESFGADGIVAIESIKSVRDFNKKRVAVQPGFVNHFFLLYLLQRVSLTQDDIIVYPMEPDKAANALLAGDVDVAVTWEPHLSVIKNREGYALILTTADSIARHLIVDNLIIREDVLKERKQDVEKLMAVWFRTLNFIKENPNESADIIAKAFDISVGDVKDMLKGVNFISLENNLKFFDKTQEFSFYTLANKALELYSDAGIIEHPSRAQPLFDKINGKIVASVKSYD